MARTGIRTAADLRDRCIVDPITGCWRHASGWRTAWFPALGRRCSWGVIACWLSTGAAPARGEVWHVTCRTADCACPAHRAKGTRSSQMLAMQMTRSPAVRARLSAAALSRSGKVSDADLELIRRDGTPLDEIVTRHGVSYSYASELRSGRVRASLGSAPGSSVFAGWGAA